MLRLTVFAFLSGIFLLSIGCNKQPQSHPVSQEDFVGNWKVNNPQLGTYFMTLNPDGSGNSTRSGGELGQWHWKADHIELEWMPKKMTFYFDSGSSQPKDPPKPDNENSIAEKVEKMPAE